MTNEQKRKLEERVVKITIFAEKREEAMAIGMQMAKAAWEMATKAERERCAKLAEYHGPHLVPGLVQAILNPPEGR